MKNHAVFVRHDNEAVSMHFVYAASENQAVVAASKMNLGGVIFAVRGQYDTLPV